MSSKFCKPGATNGRESYFLKDLNHCQQMSLSSKYSLNSQLAIVNEHIHNLVKKFSGSSNIKNSHRKSIQTGYPLIGNY